MNESIKQMKSSLSYERDKLQHALNLFKLSVESLNDKIKDRDEDKFIFEPREMKTLIDSLGAKIFMVTIGDFLKKSNEFINEVDMLEAADELYKCPYADECINCTNHCLRFNERIDGEGKEKCFNFKAEEPIKVVKEYTKTEDELRDFVKKMLKRNPEVSLTIVKMTVAKSFKNISEETRVKIIKEEIGLK